MKQKQSILMIILISISVLLLTACGSNDKDKNTAKGDKDDDVYKVVIDPGHGGKDKGSTSASGRYEKAFTLSLGKKVEKMLKKEPDIKVYMTRDDDSFISQTSRYRPKFANKLNADIFISIHGNTFSNPDVSGTQTFYYHDGSLPLAETMQKHVAKATGFSDRGVKRKDLFVVRDTNMPAVLIEVGFLSNPQDEAKMYTDPFQKRVAASIVDGIKEYRSQSKEQGIGDWFF
ncbi:N-acetylmuramoyl-L-alanine amidase family protein [Tuberibacillus sp. Marseille-P3662]|uniref:N-acetylmuramoyl-L-alanine amidase family protein n=1 Tax=Tuberibacillus sp. Marseille-P3662 TaxID=1965358 RepID=UPI000A1C9DA9|nr:N-acetylmuramoyl-L-alanine amidase [Tuberibacillus sp. Marseille-P3662]